MIKIFTLLNLAGLLVFNMFTDGDIGVTQQLPARIDPGAEVRVNVTVNKADITGFAKLQIDLPAGLTATAIETKGASFTFADGKAKFIWMAMPAQPSFEVSYTLSAANSANGTFPITGRLSYIADNERKTVDMAPTTIIVGDGNSSMTAQNTSNTTPSASTPNDTTVPQAAAMMNTDEPNSTSKSASNAATATVAAPIPQTPPQAPTHLSAKRVITPVNSTTSLVTVSIDKGDLRGFGKLQETIPAGFTAVAKTNDDAIFTATGQVVKFVWLNLPSKSGLTVSYQLMANTVPQGQYTINGNFGYLLNDLTEQYEVGQTSFSTGENAAVAQQVPAPAPAPKPVKMQPAPKPAPVPSAPQTVTAQASSPKVTSIPAPESGISYKVQITAAHREVGHQYFVQRHHYDGAFSIEHNEGWIKYVTGDFQAYRDARAQRQTYIAANYNFPGPFVTAYNNGERITVQEALMIARQHSAQ